MIARHALGVVAWAALLLVAGCADSRRVEGLGPPQCDGCHGLPPATGAHLTHVGGSALGPPFGCETCHVVPKVPHHADGVARVTFGPAATHGGATKPTWDGARCAGTYCHGATLRDGSNTTPAWNGGAAEATCGSCHGIPPGKPHPAATSCAGCHPGYTATAVNLALHLNGAIDAGTACGDCHGVPPATGAHLVHATPSSPASKVYGSLHVLEDVSPAGAPSYDFGCGNCHPLDPAQHYAHVGPVGVADVFLDPAGAPSTSLRGRNLPGARYDPASRTCSGVFCHSSGRDLGVVTSQEYQPTPPWDGPPGALGCGSCHANPPRYASGGAGAVDANSHVVLGDDGWESGHFLGMPGPWHTSKHGGNWSADNDAAPITCQTCHAETVDPAAAGPSGFYWLDTTGHYQLPGGDPGRIGTAWYDQLECTACHDGVTAPVGSGKVLPLRHVNGRRDVTFDPRTAVSAISWLPAAPSTPTRPYWVTNAAPGVLIPDPAIPDAVMDGTTLSVHLGSAAYDPATKTCTSVACHLGQTAVRWGAPHGWAACGQCHPF